MRNNILELPIQKHYLSSLSTWHPYYLDMSGKDIPCLQEFMKLMECIKINKNQISSCNNKYYDLKTCLKKKGFDIK